MKIGNKLIIIICITVIVSFISVFSLISNLTYKDLRTGAEENNLEINRRCAIEAESYINDIRENTEVLIQSGITAQNVNYFFSLNKKNIAALYFSSDGKEERIFINSDFFAVRGRNKDRAAEYFNERKFALGRAARGESLLLNASPFFRIPCVALFFPWSERGTAAVLFSPEKLNNNFTFGSNRSFMINSEGDIIAVSDNNILNNSVSLASERFIYNIVSDTEKSKQQLLNVNLSFLENNSYVKTKNIRLNAIELFFLARNKIIEFIPDITGVNDGNAAVKENNPKCYLAYTKLNTAGAVIITVIEYDKIFESINTVIIRSIFLAILLLIIFIFCMSFFSKTISVPVKSMALAVKEIESGNFDMELKTHNNDEIGMLTGNINKMCNTLNVFSSFINKDIAVKAMLGEIKPGGFPKHATIFFSDINGFKAKLEQIRAVYGSGAPDKIVSWINAYFNKMIDCIEKTNGIADKYIGDAIMAHWGTAHSAGNPRKDAFNCIKAALMMRKELYYLNGERDKYDQGNPSIRIGCGINTGMVTAGLLGSEKRKEYTVIGEPVFIAARIEALAEPFGTDILISEDTWRLVGDKFITEEMPPVSIEGKKNPVRVFAVINFQGEEKGPQTLAEVREILGIKIKDAENIEEIEELNDLEEI